LDWLETTEFLLKQYRKRKQELSDMLASGGAKDYPQYQRIVGEITGLEFAEQEILDLHKRMRVEHEDGE
jgi:hypothetical protein|tara:strand:+ start:413 stop:619 length:207 start_codon:yes stop_codon:yes gene_type:complete